VVIAVGTPVAWCPRTDPDERLLAHPVLLADRRPNVLASPDNLVETRVLRNPAETKEVRSGVTYRNLSIAETSFINWVFPHAGGIRCPSYAYSALAHVRC